MQVTGVERGGPAERLGIRRGDVVFQLGRWYVTDTDRLGAILEDVRAGEAMRIGIVRGIVRGNVRAWATIRARDAAVRRSSLIRDKVPI